MNKITNMGQIYVEDDLPSQISKYFNVPIKNIQYTNLQSSLPDDPVSPINIDYLFFTPNGIVSSSNTSGGLTINPIKREIDSIIPPNSYIQYSVLFKKIYNIIIPEFQIRMWKVQNSMQQIVQIIYYPLIILLKN